MQHKRQHARQHHKTENLENGVQQTTFTTCSMHPSTHTSVLTGRNLSAGTSYPHSSSTSSLAICSSGFCLSTQPAQSSSVTPWLPGWEAASTGRPTGAWEGSVQAEDARLARNTATWGGGGGVTQRRKMEDGSLYRDLPF